MASAPSPAREARAFPNRLCAFFDRCADFIAPFGPRTIVIANVIESQEVGEHKPSVTRAFANSAIDNCIPVGTDSALIEIDFCQFPGWLKCGVIIGGGLPRHALCSWNVAAAQHAVLRILLHVRDLAPVFARRPHVDQWFSALALR